MDIGQLLAIGLVVAVVVAAAALLEVAMERGWLCRLRGHNWEWGLGRCTDCGADNPDDPSRAP